MIGVLIVAHDSLGESLVPIRWQAVILDEGQYIKNPNSQTAQVARASDA